MSTIIALPSTHPGGLEAEPSDHFGQCDAYTLVTLKDTDIEDVEVLPNPTHEHGDCLGRRPLAGFTEAGIIVLHDGGAATVREALDALLTGRLHRFGNEHMCASGGGHGGCH